MVKTLMTGLLGLLEKHDSQYLPEINALSRRLFMYCANELQQSMWKLPQTKSAREPMEHIKSEALQIYYSSSHDKKGTYKNSAGSFDWARAYNSARRMVILLEVIETALNESSQKLRAISDQEDEESRNLAA